jgi:signal transduction histidine kinase
MNQTVIAPSSRTLPSDASVSGIAHDLNNSVQVTLSVLELLQGRLQRGLTDEIPRLIDQAVMSAALASKTGRRLMDLSQSRRGVGIKCIVNNLLLSMEPMLRHALGSASDLILTFDSSSAAVACDPVRLQNALLNLVMNAKDAMQSGGTVVVSVSRTEAACARSPGEFRSYVRIVITDNGHGMTKEVLSRVCTAFFTTKPAGKGTGLGLSTVKSFVDELEGSLDIESTPGCGTSISILLPCEDVGDRAHSAA